MTNKEIRTEATMAHRETGREFFVDVVKLVDELERVRGLLQRQWISVEERLPKEGQTVLIAHQNGGLRTWVADFKDGQFLELENQWPMKLTEFWAELPEPPSGAESAYIGKLDKVTVEERHYEDGRIQRKIGNGEWEDVPNPTGRPLFAKLDIGKLDSADKSDG